mmetsp:Transcript_53957/g.144532  ORF Transcript_53957/g.144532 Transcript_53957/m.144532 type:complete len:270 (+) Transcript_53957:542-1351(+)
MRISSLLSSSFSNTVMTSSSSIIASNSQRCSTPSPSLSAWTKICRILSAKTSFMAIFSMAILSESCWATPRVCFRKSAAITRMIAKLTTTVYRTQNMENQGLTSMTIVLALLGQFVVNVASKRVQVARAAVPKCSKTHFRKSTLAVSSSRKPTESWTIRMPPATMMKETKSMDHSRLAMLAFSDRSSTRNSWNTVMNLTTLIALRTRVMRRSRSSRASMKVPSWLSELRGVRIQASMQEVTTMVTSASSPILKKDLSGYRYTRTASSIA